MVSVHQEKPPVLTRANERKLLRNLAINEIKHLLLIMVDKFNTGVKLAQSHLKFTCQLFAQAYTYQSGIHINDNEIR